MKLQLFSPAKINLFLRVVSKKAEGYHLLSSLFQAVTLGDTLTIALSSKDTLTCSNPFLSLDQTNLVVKARNLFRKKTGITQPFSIHLEKLIPMQAGLGGGSSNAATVLWGCNQLMNTQIEEKELSQWGASLGSDVAFFFSYGTAYCTGRGENVEKIDPLPHQDLWIVKPFYGLSTAHIFQNFQFKKTSCIQNSVHDLSQFLSGNLLPFNDLEEVAFKINPDLLELKNQLIQQGFHTVLMTGSGSAFFCLGKAFPLTHATVTNFAANYCQRSAKEWYQNPHLKKF